METSSPCIQTALLRCSICTPTGDAANSMTNSSEVMCLKQKPQRTLIPNYQWTQCYVCRLWISTLPVVGKHERACGVCTHALSHDWICAFFFCCCSDVCRIQFGTLWNVKSYVFSPGSLLFLLHREAAEYYSVSVCQYFLTFCSCSIRDTQPVVYPLYTPLLDY